MTGLRCFAMSMFLGTLMIVGCGSDGPEISGVTGTVTMDGQPLPNASVVFIPENGRPAGATTDEEGKYELNFSGGRRGAMPGMNKIRISTLRDPSEDVDGNRIPGSPETVPMKYNTLSELTFDVKSDQANVADFDLTSEGEITTENMEE